MDHRAWDISYVVFAIAGSIAFWGLMSSAMRPNEPHPGLRDDALQEALRKDRTHDRLSYYEARKHLFGKVDGNGKKAECVYTGNTLEYFKQPLPNTGAVEHSWPITRLPSDARSDLHHMYAVDPEARVARLNLHYGKVFIPVWADGGSRSGPSSKVKPVFEVRSQRRGDIARSMFYVATMYDLDIPSSEESKLRQWHTDDPVDADERARNDRVQKQQRSRNPFIDHPGLTKRISDF